MRIYEVVDMECIAELDPGRRFSKEWLRGVTQVKHWIFVLYRQSIAVFQGQRPFEKQRDIELNLAREADDMVGDSVSNQLFVSQCGSRKILRVDVTSREVSLFVRHEHAVSRMSMTSGRLLVTSCDSRPLYVYNVNDGSKSLVIQLHSVVKEARHAVETPRGTFIVCYHSQKPMHSNKYMGKLMEISSDGRIIRKLNDEEELYDPIQLALDSMDRVLFIDWDGNRVAVLNNALRFIAAVQFDKKKLKAPPSRLYYDVNNKQLFVGLMNGRVNIYKWI